MWLANLLGLLKSSWKYKTYIGIGLAAVVISSVMLYGYVKINNLEGDNKDLSHQLETQRIELEQTKANFNELNSRFIEYTEKVRESIETVQEFKKIQKELDKETKERINDIENLYSTDQDGNSTDVDSIIDEDPSLIERRINDATAEFKKEIEDITR